MRPPNCVKIGTLRYEGELLDYVYDHEADFCALFGKEGILAGLGDEETIREIAEFLNENYHKCNMQKIGFGIILDLFFEYVIRDDFLYLQKVYLRCWREKELVLNKKATWKERITIKTPEGFKTYFHFQNAKLMRIEKTREECRSLGDRLKMYIED